MQDIQEQAKREGWRLVTTFENGTTKPLWDIAGVSVSDQAAKSHVVAQAKNLSALHQRALQLVIQSRAGTAKGKKK